MEAILNKFLSNVVGGPKFSSAAYDIPKLSLSTRVTWDGEEDQTYFIMDIIHTEPTQIIMYLGDDSLRRRLDPKSDVAMQLLEKVSGDEEMLIKHVQSENAKEAIRQLFEQVQVLTKPCR